MRMNDGMLVGFGEIVLTSNCTMGCYECDSVV